MFDKLIQITNSRTLFRSLLFMLFMITIMNLGATAFYQYTGGIGIFDTAGGANLLDNRIGGYLPERAYQMISAYGQQGIRFHLLLTLIGDTIFPTSLALFFWMALAYLYSSLFPPQVVRWFILLPAVYLAADYLENISIVTMLLRFPTALPIIAVTGNMLFMLKNISSAAMVITTLAGLVAWLFQRAHRLSAA